MTLWHHTAPSDFTDSARHAPGSSKRSRDAVRSTDRWPPVRAFVFMVMTNLALWAVIVAGFWLLF